jgi:hypothetical protein
VEINRASKTAPQDLKGPPSKIQKTHSVNLDFIELPNTLAVVGEIDAPEKAIRWIKERDEFFNFIPLEIYPIIFSYLKITSLGRFACTKSTMKDLVKKIIAMSDKFPINLIDAAAYFNNFEINVTHLNLRITKDIFHIKKFTQLTHLNVFDYQLASLPPYMEFVGALPNLQSFCLPKDYISDFGLVFLRNSTKLHTLSLGCADITYNGIAQLKNLSQLTHVNLNECKGGNVLTSLCSLFQLKYLEYTKCGYLVKNEVESITKLTDIQYLSFSGCGLDDNALLYFSSLTNLTHLNLNCYYGNRGSLGFCTKLTSLRYLNLADCNMDRKEFIHLKGLTNLRQLTIGDNDPVESDSDLIDNIANLPLLEKIDICNMRITNGELQKFSENKTIRSLEINGKLLNRGFEIINRMTNLEYLHINDGVNINSQLSRLEGLINLEVLKVTTYYRHNHTNLGIDCLLSLNKLTNLKVLYLEHRNDFTNEAIEKFKQLSKLKFCEFSRVDGRLIDIH